MLSSSQAGISTNLAYSTDETKEDKSMFGSGSEKTAELGFEPTSLTVNSLALQSSDLLGRMEFLAWRLQLSSLLSGLEPSSGSLLVLSAALRAFLEDSG